MKLNRISGPLLLLTILAALLTVPVYSATGQAGIKNKIPQIGTVSLSPDDDPGLAGTQVNPSAGSTKTVMVTAQVDDGNGFNDIQAVSVVVLKPDGSATHIASGNAHRASGNGTHSIWTYAFNMSFYDNAAVGTSTYKVVVTATDIQGASASNSGSPATFNYTELVALSLGATTLDFGELDPGQPSSTISLVGTNLGNVTLDLLLSGTSFTYGSYSIDVGRVKYDLTGNFITGTALTAGNQTFASYDLTYGSSSSKAVYFRLDAPSGAEQYLPQGSYQGSIGIVAAKSQ
jgi:hypothetical protein